MNKSTFTNLFCILLIIIGYSLLPQALWLMNAGIFGLSGALTNWLAVYMLFERIPLLYGSGVIPNQFEKFRDGIRMMIMEQFFTKQYLRDFLNTNAMSWMPDFDTAIDELDYDLMFERLIEAIAKSSLGNMLAMVGGAKALEPLREPIKEKMRTFLRQFLKSKEFHSKIVSALNQDSFSDKLYQNIEAIVAGRLQQLTPQLVKDIIQKMIKEHLGWLVVWGGFFGGLIGIVYTFVV